jgi:putative ABC transport system permease protein
MTAVGIALPTAALLFALALPAGLNRVLRSSGDESRLVILRKGAVAETGSAIDRETARLIETLPGIAKNAANRPLCSPEAAILVNVPRRDGKRTNLLVRGTGERGRELRPAVRLVEGRWFEPGLPELTVSRRIATRFENLGLGETIKFGRSDWRVVGIFEAAGTSSDSEAWADADLLMADFRRTLYTSVLVRAVSPEVQASIVRTLAEDERFSLRGVPEPEYFALQTREVGIPVEFVGMLVSILLAVGATVGAANTMYAAVAQRTREIAVLRAIGFRRRAVLASFLFETFLLALAGGAVGCAIAFAAFHGRATSTVNWISFSDVVFQFRITPDLLGYGMVFAVAIGLLGGALPARLAASRGIAASMRAI